MRNKGSWIWLPRERYPDSQSTVYSAFLPSEPRHYAVAEFWKEYTFSQKVRRLRLRFSADTALQLFCNGEVVATGPNCVGGDFMGNETPREPFYASELTLFPDTDRLTLFARVQLQPLQLCEYSKGHGGFMLSATVTLADGTRQQLGTDESWLTRKNGGYCAPHIFDGRIAPEPYTNAEGVEDRWNAVTAPIPVRRERLLLPENGRLLLAPYEEREAVLELERIWAGFLWASADAPGVLQLQVMCRERQEQTLWEQLYLTGKQTYRGFYLHSAGNLRVRIKNNAGAPAVVELGLIATHYPVSREADTVTDDPELDSVLRVCKHTLKLCRQTHHLDSPRHCEPLACTGDYYIESLMTPFSFGDMRLAEFDLLRTASTLEREDGRLFHTTYSLIWVRMLRDVYRFTGHKGLLKACERALGLLLRRFEGYMGENGLIERPPDYMFVDWIYIDGHSLHHPPKALGQTCLNLFYFAALEAAADIYTVLEAAAAAEACLAKRRALGAAVNRWLYDPERGCYFEGSNTPTEPELIGRWMPRNVQKRYYLKHSNILAACFGVCGDDMGRQLLHRVLRDEIPGDCQPYFMHYLLEAVYRLGLREQYTYSICSRWKLSVKEFSKGLVEGFVPPEPGYHFDHSHAWGGAPLYALPKALLGLEILEPGMKELSLSPSLLGLGYAKVQLLTPYGRVSYEMRQGQRPRITHPKQLRIRIKESNG